MADLLTLSLAQFEDGLPVMAELDLTQLISAFIRLKAELPELDFGGDPKVVLATVLQNPAALTILMPLLQTLGQAGRGHILRRISAIVNASDDVLIQAERQPVCLQELEDQAARRPYLDGAQDLLRFFSRLGLTGSVSPDSSREEPKPERSEDAQAPQAEAGTTRSGDS